MRPTVSLIHYALIHYASASSDGLPRSASVGNIANEKSHCCVPSFGRGRLPLPDEKQQNQAKKALQVRDDRIETKT